MTRRFLLSVLLLLGSLSLAMAQPSDTVVPNPNAVKLQRIWMIRGGDVNSGDQVGEASGSLGDIDGDGLGDFAVRIGKTGDWKVFLGASPAPDTTPVWTFHHASADLPYPVIGNFHGNGRPLLALSRDTCNADPLYCFFRLYLFTKLSSGAFTDTPTTILNTGIQFCPRAAFAADLDGDGADELVLTRSCSYPEIWIYKGGADFDVNQPTLKIGDSDFNSSDAHYSAIADFDGDGFLDLITGAGYQNNPKLKIWFGRQGSPWNWSTPDRVISSEDGFPWFSGSISALDCDGDRIADLVVNGNYIFRSASGKSFRDRSFSLDDADQWLPAAYFSVHHNGGFLNDPSRRFATTLIINPGEDRFDGSELRAFSGGPDGPDKQYDAYYRTDLDGLIEGSAFQNISPLLDCNGDGWDDLLVSSPFWWGYNQGIAIVLSGGPTIPQDFPPSAVETVAAEEKSDALKLWPVPAHDKLNIYWRGDLLNMPTRFSIYDITGRRIASGDVESSSGAALWNCSDVPPGTYLLTAFDEHNEIIATTTFIKE